MPWLAIFLLRPAKNNHSCQWIWLSGFFALGLFMGGSLAQGELDLSLSALGRSYPVGGGLTVKAGEGWLLWGDRPSEGPEKNPWYGYARPAVEFTTAGTYNYGEARFELFPLSFIGVSGGASLTHVSEDYQNYDCKTYQCMGVLSGEFVEGLVVMGFGSLFLVAQGRWDRLYHSKDKTYIEVESALLGDPEFEQKRNFRGGLGLKLNESWYLALAGVYSEMEKTEGMISRMGTVNLGYSSGEWAYLVGGGLFESPLKESQATAIMRIRWTAWPPLSIF